MTRTLFEISDDMQALDDMLDEAEGDITNPAIEAAVDLWFTTLDAEATEKIDNYAAFIQELKSRCAARKAEGKRLKRRADIDEARANWLIERLYQFFLRHGIRRKDTDRYRISIQSHGGVLPLNVIASPEDLPAEYTTVTITPNNSLLREALERGEKIEGVFFGERGQGLRIR